MKTYTRRPELIERGGRRYYVLRGTCDIVDGPQKQMIEIEVGDKLPKQKK